ncbi:lactoylglutathione lyase [Prevotella sp. oral taxon 376]|uniref:VOC family protein n=1 Tax=Prevotella sp. oral taxon 376 TaxID=712466 RepID=UPI000D1D9BCC|nr:VOC family protein [Prevotella sp. oral taxon 376]PTL32901.1 lactoylglutathione lyase [Prevotella sp. oral taxon 376]
MKTDNYFFPATDFEAAKHFYGELLGLAIKFDFSPMGMIAYKIGSDEPAIILKDITRYSDAKPALWIEVEDVMEEYSRLKEKGIQFLSKPFRIKTGWAVEFDDPSGNRLGITDYKAM